MKRETRLKTTALSREIKELTKTINELVRKRAELRHDHRRLLDSDKEHQIRVLSKRLAEHKKHYIEQAALGNHNSQYQHSNQEWRAKEILKLEDTIAQLKADIAIEEALK